MYGVQCAWGAAQPQRTCALHGAAQCAQRIYGAQCACMGRSSAAAHMRTARRGAAHCPADKMGAADGTCCARCVLSALCCTRCAPCALRSISALLYTLCAALHVCDTARCAACFETFKSQENTRKITIYIKSTVFFFPFWESSGLEMAGWLAGLGAGEAGWAGRLAGAGRQTWTWGSSYNLFRAYSNQTTELYEMTNQIRLIDY